MTRIPLLPTLDVFIDTKNPATKRVGSLRTQGLSMWWFGPLFVVRTPKNATEARRMK